MQDYSNAALETISQEYSTNDGLRRQLCLCQEKYKRLVLEYRPPLEHFSSVEVCDRALRALTITFKDILAIKVRFTKCMSKDAPLRTNALFRIHYKKTRLIVLIMTRLLQFAARSVVKMNNKFTVFHLNQCVFARAVRWNTMKWLSATALCIKELLILQVGCTV